MIFRGALENMCSTVGAKILHKPVDATLDWFETTVNEQPSLNFAGMLVDNYEDIFHINQYIFTRKSN